MDMEKISTEMLEEIFNELGEMSSLSAAEVKSGVILLHGRIKRQLEILLKKNGQEDIVFDKNEAPNKRSSDPFSESVRGTY